MPLRMPLRMVLGSLLSAALVGVGFTAAEGPVERLLPWFAMVPLLVALHSARERGGSRWLHGITFGWILCAWSLHPLVQADLAAAGGADAIIFDVLGVVLRNGVLWTALSLHFGAFAWASGLLFRSRYLSVSLVGLPIVWVAIEVFRSSFSPIPVSWILLGESIDSGDPETGIVSIAGVVGLGGAIVFTNVAFALVVVERRAARQFLLAALGCLAFAACYIEGTTSGTDTFARHSVRIGIVQIDERSVDTTLEFADQIIGSYPDLVVFPGLAFVVPESFRLDLEGKLLEFARLRKVDVIAGVGLIPGTASRLPGDDDLVSTRGGFTLRDSGFVFVSRDGGIARFGNLRDARRPPGAFDDTGRAAAVIDTTFGKLGVGLDEAFDAPAIAQQLVAGGAQILIALGGEEARAGEQYAATRARMQAPRALETGTFLVRATLSGRSGIWDARGAPREQAIAGSPWANVSPVAMRDAEDPHTTCLRSGWLLGPIAVGLSAGILVAAAFEPLARRRRRHARTEPPA